MLTVSARGTHAREQKSPISRLPMRVHKTNVYGRSWPRSLGGSSCDSSGGIVHGASRTQTAAGLANESLDFSVCCGELELIRGNSAIENFAAMVDHQMAACAAQAEQHVVAHSNLEHHAETKCRLGAELTHVANAKVNELRSEFSVKFTVATDQQNMAMF